MENIKGFLIDLDGVLYIDDQIISGAIETINHLKKNGYILRFLTNTTTKSFQQVYLKLLDLGLPVDKKEIITAPIAALSYLKKENIKNCYLVMNEHLKDDFHQLIQDDEKPEAIIIGDIEDKWDYHLMNKLFNFMMNGSNLIAFHKVRFRRREVSLQIDIGAFIHGLEYATGKKSIVMGKPSKAFYHMALEQMKLSADQVLMIGDDIDSDIGGAQEVGIKAILVKTGKYNSDYVKSRKIHPFMTISSIADIKKLL